MDQQTKESVQEYYGKILKTKEDLKTSACCSIESIPKHHQNILKLIDEEIRLKFYGCGSPIPDELEGKTVLDLGCGTGRDVYLMSKLVGPTGKVIGVDMTDEQLEVAKRHIQPQMEKFGFEKPNVEFVKGFIEDLSFIEDNSVDIVISNCVVNLSPKKEEVFKEIFRVLKQGGELYFSDVFSDRRVPQHIKEDPVIYGECLGGALYIEDFRRLLHKIGYPDYRVIKQSPIALLNPEIEKKAGMITFTSLTVRVFKLQSMEDICEDYGQVATYLGTIEHHPHSFTLDNHHVFHTKKPMLVCGNTAAMLQETRFSEHFKIDGDRETHLGVFDCGKTSNCGPSNNSQSQNSQGSGCC